MPPKGEIDDEFQGDKPKVASGGYSQPLWRKPPAWINCPLVWIMLVPAMGLLYVPGAQMSRNYGIRPDYRQVYIPPEEKFSRASMLISMVSGVIMLGALIVGMMVLAQVLHEIIGPIL